MRAYFYLIQREPINIKDLLQSIFISFQNTECSLFHALFHTLLQGFVSHIFHDIAHDSNLREIRSTSSYRIGGFRH